MINYAKWNKSLSLAICRKSHKYVLGHNFATEYQEHQNMTFDTYAACFHNALNLVCHTYSIGLFGCVREVWRWCEIKYNNRLNFKVLYPGKAVKTISPFLHKLRSRLTMCDLMWPNEKGEGTPWQKFRATRRQHAERAKVTVAHVDVKYISIAIYCLIDKVTSIKNVHASGWDV